MLLVLDLKLSNLLGLCQFVHNNLTRILCLNQVDLLELIG